MAKLVKQKHGGALVRPAKGETMNPNGRPPKVLTKLVRELRAKGYEKAGRVTVLETFEALMGLPEAELLKLGNDVEQPMIVRIVVRSMLSKEGFLVLQAMLDRTHGKPMQSHAVKTDQTVRVKFDG